MAEEPSEDGRLTVWAIWGGTGRDIELFITEFFGPNTGNFSTWKWGSESPEEAREWVERYSYNLIVMVEKGYSPSDYLVLEDTFNVRMSFMAYLEDYEPF